MSCSTHRRPNCTVSEKCRRESRARRSALSSTDVSFDDGSSYDYGTASSYDSGPSSSSCDSSSSSSDTSSSSSSCDSY